MRGNKLIHHSSQPEEERTYLVVIKYLHHSVDVQDLRDDISHHEHEVRSIINANHRVAKQPLNLLFIDLETSDDKVIYKLHRLKNVIQI